MCWIVLLLSPIVWLEFIEMIIFFYFALFGVAVVFQALCLTLWDPMNGSMPGFLVLHISWSLFRLMSIESVMLSNHLILCCPLLLLPSLFTSIRVFSSGSVLCLRWPNYSSSWSYWSFRFSISTSGEYSELISFRIDWFDLLTVQGTLKNLLQHHRWKASILWCSAFLYGPTLTSVHDYWKNHSFDYMDLCWQVMSLLFNMLSRFVITFPPRSKCFLISWAVTICSDFGAQENKVCHCFHCFSIYLPWSDGTGCHDLSFFNIGF